MKKLLSILTFAALLSGCGPRIYKSAEFDGALAKHRTVAILPAEVTMKLRPNETKKMTREQMDDLAMKNAFDIQEKMYGWFLRRGEKYHYTVSFQDVTKTNARLKEAGIEYKDLRSTDRSRIAKILGVDAVIQDRAEMDKPMSEGASAAIGVLTGSWQTTNRVQTTINIHDGKSGDLLWKYDYEASGSVGSSTGNLVDALLRNASKKFPYSAK
jgi:hypothetical protein